MAANCRIASCAAIEQQVDKGLDVCFPTFGILMFFQANTTAQYPAMGARASFGAAFARIPCTNVVIRTIARSTKTNETSVETVAGSEFMACSESSLILLRRKCIRMGMKKDGESSLIYAQRVVLSRVLLAVQKERDRLGRQRSQNYTYGIAHSKSNIDIQGGGLDEVDDDDDLSVMSLLRAEKTAQEVRPRHKPSFVGASSIVCLVHRSTDSTRSTSVH